MDPLGAPTPAHLELTWQYLQNKFEGSIFVHIYIDGTH